MGSTLTQRQYLNMYKGALYSAHHDLNRFKPENLVKTRCDTPVQNLVQGKVVNLRPRKITMGSLGGPNGVSMIPHHYEIIPFQTTF